MPKSAEPTLVVRHALAARQWEAELIAADPVNAEANVCPSPRLRTLDAWLVEIVRDGSGADIELLSRGQADALWRRVIAESPYGEGLLEPAGAGRWAADAWRRLADADVDPSDLRAGPEQGDFAAFLDWCRAYRAELEAAGWHDGAALRLALPGLDLPPSGDVELLDTELAPVEAGLVRRLDTRDWRVKVTRPARRAGRCHRVACDDAEAELDAALNWAAERARRHPSRRVAVVLRNAPRQAPLIDRRLARLEGEHTIRESTAFAILAERRRSDRPLVAAARNALELCSRRGSFTHLSRWLRGPLVVGTDVAGSTAAARLELDLRGRLLAQVGFLDAYRFGGLRNRFLRDLPVLAERMDRALQATVDDRARCPPTGWITVWQRILGALGWSETIAELDPEGLSAWEKALEEFAALTAMFGELDHGAALDELGRILATPRQDGPYPPTGVHVLTRMEQIGPGYDAAWITGLTATSLPEPARTNPLLPRALQVELGLPWSTPGDALQRAKQSLADVQERVNELVLSCPVTEYDFETSPSPLITGVRPLSAEALGERDRHGASTGELEVIDDTPAARPGGVIRGGAQTLSLQARCPLRAFCQSRLDARPIEAPERGVSARHQGIAVHRVLELLMLGQAATGAAMSGEALDEAIETALEELFRGARRPLSTLFSLEQARIRHLIERFLEAEALRAPWTPEQFEEQRDIDVAGFTVRVRIDRVDRLADGSLAILDYKSGRQIARPGWFKARLQDPQLPLYLLDAGNRAAGIVIVALEPQGTRYIGLWTAPDAFPGRPLTAPEGRSWTRQRALWRTQLETLVTEIGRGDVRLYPGDLDPARGLYAPLSRVHEALAMRYGVRET